MTPFLQSTARRLLLIIAVSQLLTIFAKKLHRRCLAGLTSGSGFKMLSSLLFPVFKLSRENTQPENMCDIIFEKTKSGVYAEATVLKGALKKVF